MPPPPLFCPGSLRSYLSCLSLELFSHLAAGIGFAYVFTVQLAWGDEGGAIIPLQRTKRPCLIIFVTARVQN
jgi:hypothetical protein